MDEFKLIKQYKELLDDGIITQEEFDQKKESLLKLDSLGNADANEVSDDVQENSTIEKNNEITEHSVLVDTVDSDSILAHQADNSPVNETPQIGKNTKSNFWNSMPKLYRILIIAGVAIVLIGTVLNYRGSTTSPQSSSPSENEEIEEIDDQLSYLQGSWTCTLAQESGHGKEDASDYYLEIEGDQCTGYVFDKHIDCDITFYLSNENSLSYYMQSYPRMIIIYSKDDGAMGVFNTDEMGEVSTADSALFR